MRVQKQTHKIVLERARENFAAKNQKTPTFHWKGWQFELIHHPVFAPNFFVSS
jgi:hypothetical protein